MKKYGTVKITLLSWRRDVTNTYTPLLCRDCAVNITVIVAVTVDFTMTVCVNVADGDAVIVTVTETDITQTLS